MNLLLIFFIVAVAILLTLLLWAINGPQETAENLLTDTSLEEIGRRHVVFFSQIRQALAPQDLSFLASRGSRKLARRVRKERRRVAVAHLSALKGDFRKLLRLARIVSLLSPTVVPLQEYEQFRLSALFSMRCEWIRVRLLLGNAPLAQLTELSGVVSGLAVRINAAITELGERAALASQLASSLEGRRMSS